MAASCPATVPQRCSWPATEAGVFRTFPGPPGKRLILPGKLAVRGLPGAKRRDAEAAGRSALDRELSRRQHARRGRTARRLRKRGQPGCVTAGTAWRRVRENGAAAAARAVRPHAKAAGLGRRPPAARPPGGPSRLRRESLACPTLSLGGPCAHARSPARARRPGAPKACHLRRKESCHTSDNTCCLGWSFGGFRWSEGGREPRTASRGLTTHVYSSA